MDSYGIKRKIDFLGRVSIPVGFRRDADMDCGTEVEICRIKEGILIKRVADSEQKGQADER